MSRAKEFSDPYIPKRLFASLEYESIVWDHHCNIDSNHVKNVWKQLLLFCLRSLRWNYIDMPSYSCKLPLLK